MAVVSVVLPWSMWPMVPTLTCSFLMGQWVPRPRVRPNGLGRPRRPAAGGAAFLSRRANPGHDGRRYAGGRTREGGPGFVGRDGKNGTRMTRITADSRGSGKYR